MPAKAVRNACCYEKSPSSIRKSGTWKSVYAYTHKNSHTIEFVCHGRYEFLGICQPKLFPELVSKVRFGDTSSDDSFSRTQEWLSQCCSSHTLCNQKLGRLLPRRVIDVSGGSVRLVEIQTQIDRYIALSHCWRDSRPPCLTTLSTIKTNLCAIEWESIPDTFKHAIQITRKLGVQFLWIDSLCIVQDDNLDWEEESSKMASIYRNSYLTLCATQAPSDDDGLWPSLPVSTLHKIWFREDQVAYAVHLRAMHIIPVWEYVRVLSPIATRSWTFQEQILSPRVLHFGNGELLWECMEGSTCECSSTGEFNWSYAHRNEKTEIYKVLSSGDLEKIANLWRSLVEQYSRLSMTLSKDMFPALSGIAQTFQSAQETRKMA
ncbi:HET domain containing protein [Hyaloscypha variabilis]